MPVDPKDEIKDRFAAEYEDEQPSLSAAVDAPTADIVAQRQRAAARFAELAGLILTPAQQQALSGKRIPGADHIAELFGAALAGSPGIEKAIGITGKHFTDAVLQDRAAGRVVMAGQVLST